MKDLLKKGVTDFERQFRRWSGSLNKVYEVVVIYREHHFRESVGGKDSRGETRLARDAWTKDGKPEEINTETLASYT